MMKGRKRSEKWRVLKEDIEEAGEDWAEFRRQSLAGIDINNIRIAAAAAGIDTGGSKAELCERLVSEDCFRGAAHDETVYQDSDGEAVPLAGRRGVLGASAGWRQLREPGTSQGGGRDE